MSDMESNQPKPETAAVTTNACDSNAALCCSQFYEQDIVQELMGGSFHPGGEDLSKQLVTALGLNAGAKVLDVACGVGTTTRMMANTFGFNATGLDFSEINIQKARSTAQSPVPAVAPADEKSTPCCAPGDPCCPTENAPESTPENELTQLGGNLPAAKQGTANFLQGSADSLPVEDGSFDGLTCECAVSTFADQPGVAAEFFRALKPGGMFGMTDMVVTGPLPDDFAEKAAPWTCVAKAMNVEGYQRLFEQAGFKIVQHVDHSHTLLELATEMKRKLVMAGMGKALGALPELGMSFSQMRAMLAQSTDLVKSGTIQYALLTFKK